MKAMVMIDMQNDFVDGALGTAEAQAILPAVCEKLRTKGVFIFCTMDTHGDDYMDTAEGRKLPVPHCIEGTKGWELPDMLADAVKYLPDDRMVRKPTFGAKELPARIAGVCGGAPDEIELFGVCTDICVISNALLLKAFFPEAEITVDSKCCAGTSVEAHERALEALKMCQINIV